MPRRDRFQFGKFELDVKERLLRLRKEGKPVPLSHKPLELLIYLVSHCDRVVTRDELITHFWSDAHHGADDRLNSCIRRIRKALGDGRETPQFIETSPRLGYRFIAEIQKTSMPRNRLVGLQRVFGIIAPAAATAVTAAAALLIGVLANSPSGLSAATTDLTLAVPPMEVYCDSKPFPYFEDGLRDALLTELYVAMPKKTVLLKVQEVNTQSTEDYDYYFDVSIRHFGRDVLVHASLLSNKDSRIAWAGRFKASINPADYTTAQKEISNQITQSILADKKTFVKTGA